MTVVERTRLQRRIKNQRKELKRLNMHIGALNRMIELYRSKTKEERSNAYRHAAQLAETFWFGGRRIAAYIRRWC